MAAKQTTPGSQAKAGKKTFDEEHYVAAVGDVEGTNRTPNNALVSAPLSLRASPGTVAASISGTCTETLGAAHFMGYVSSLFGLNHQGFEERQSQYNLEHVLLQQHQHQQERVFLEAAAALASIVPRPQLSADLGGDQLAKLQSTLAARTQLERAHAQLVSQQNRLLGAFDASDSTEGQNHISTTFPPQGAGNMAACDSKVARVQSLPYVDQHATMPVTSPEHEAYDDADENQDSISDQAGDLSAVAQDRFPLKLFRMLDEAEKSGNDTIVSFFPHGRAFAVHRPREFVTTLMPKYFTTSRMSSFQRQLNLYGFRRINEGRDKGGYFHKNFLRGRKDLCKSIQRKKKSRRATCDAAGREPSDDIVDNSGSAASTDALQQAILLAQLNAQNQLNLRHNYYPSMLQTFQPTASFAFPISTPSLPGPGDTIDRSMLARPGALSHIGATGDASRLQDERYQNLIKQLQSSFMNQLR